MGSPLLLWLLDMLKFTTDRNDRGQTIDITINDKGTEYREYLFFFFSFFFFFFFVDLKEHKMKYHSYATSFGYCKVHPTKEFYPLSA